MKPHNQRKNLDKRLSDFQRLMGDRNHDSKVQNRIESGGYHKPGSNRK